MKHIRLIFSLLLLISVSSCIKEDMDDCIDIGTPLYFSYLGDFNREIFPAKINEVNMYVYDENGTFIQATTLNKTDLNKLQGANLNLPNGNYHIVCWGNVFSETQIEDDTSLGSAIVAAPQYFSRELIMTNDSLYYGSLDIHLTDNRPQPDIVYFNSSHIKMLIQLVGLSSAEASSIELSVDNLSAYVNFDEQFSSIKESYFPIVSFDQVSKNYTARFNVLRFDNDNNVLINLKNKLTGQTIYTLNLKDFMTANNITVDGINEAFVGIAFTFNGLGVTVKPWNEEQITPGI